MEDCISGSVGKIDQIARAVIGSLLLILAVTVLGGSGAWIAGSIGAVLLATSAVKFCPLYKLFGFCT
ncbi:MAG: DUF2892 domain-containing protein [Pseudomonadota bacterium]